MVYVVHHLACFLLLSCALCANTESCEFIRYCIYIFCHTLSYLAQKHCLYKLCLIEWLCIHKLSGAIGTIWHKINGTKRRTTAEIWGLRKHSGKLLTKCGVIWTQQSTNMWYWDLCF